MSTTACFEALWPAETLLPQRRGSMIANSPVVSSMSESEESEFGVEDVLETHRNHTPTGSKTRTLNLPQL